jgi:hypothetical protein
MNVANCFRSFLIAVFDGMIAPFLLVAFMVFEWAGVSQPTHPKSFIYAKLIGKPAQNLSDTNVDVPLNSLVLKPISANAQILVEQGRLSRLVLCMNSQNAAVWSNPNYP